MTPTDPQSIDTLIASRLPAWLTQTDADRFALLRRSLQCQAQDAARLAEVLGDVPGLDTFAEPLLEQALQSRGVAHPDVRSSTVRITQQIKMPSVGLSLPSPVYTHVSRQSLLAAALHNFHVVETRPQLLRKGTVLDAQGRPLPISFEAFAGLCRQLDLGKAYQALLTRHLRPADLPGQPAGSAVAAVNKAFEESLRSRLEVDVRVARLKDELDETSYLQMLPVIAAKPIVPALTSTVMPRQLYLLGKCIRGAVIFEVRESGNTRVSAVIAWIPGNPHGPLARYASWSSLYQALAIALKDQTYREFFCRFISQRDRPAFLAALGERLGDGPSTRAEMLDGRHFEIAGELYAYLRQQQIDTIFDDARVLAVPTGVEDEQDRRERLDSYVAVGMSVLTLAGLFMPVLGEVLLVVGVGQIADEVYEGYKDWQIGDRQGAIDHALNIAENIVLGAAISAGSSAVVHGLERVAFVDGLAPVRLANGQVRLMATSSGEYMPAAGALHARHELAQPQYWQGAGNLVRQFGATFAELPDQAAAHLLEITGVGQDALRRLHVEGAGPTARLAEVLDLYRVHETQPGLRGAAFDEQVRAYQRQHLGRLTEHELLLLRDFPGLPLRSARELIAEATGAEFNSLAERGRVPLSIAERARWALRESRLDRANAGLRWPWLVNVDSEWLAIGSLDLLAPWPDTVRVELRSGSADGPVLVSHGVQHASKVHTIVRQPDGYLVVGASSASPDLPSALLACVDEEQLTALGPSAANGAALLDRLASAVDREVGASILGMTSGSFTLRPPRRFADGRLGYPLSGRAEGSRQAIRCGIHQIFPTLTDSQMNAYLESLTQQRIGLWEHYSMLQDHLARLRQALAGWQRGWSNPLDALRRRRVAAAIRRSWRRKITDLGEDFVLEIDGETVTRLPTLPPDISFGHIRRLRLRNMALSEIDSDFLQRFGNVVELDLTGNHLTSIPDGIEHLPRLRLLRMAHNRITLNHAGESRLATLELLQMLDLSHNPLGRAPVLTHLSRLRDVRLRNAGLETLPSLVTWRGTLDIRDNRIRQLQQDLRSLRQQMEQMTLHDNPLDAASEALVDQAVGAEAGARGGASFRHAPVNNLLRDEWIGSTSPELRARRRALWACLQDEPGSDGLFRFLADFIETDDVEANPRHYRRRIWRILEACEQHTELRQRLFIEASGPGTCEDRLLMVLEQMEITILAQTARADGSAALSETALVRLGRGLFRLDEVDRIASRHIELMNQQPTPLVDEIEVRLYYRLKLLRPLGLPIEADEMHFESFANVNTSHLLSAQQAVLAAETPQVLAESLSQRPFWSEHARELYAEDFETLAQRFHTRFEALQAEVDAQQIDDWTFDVRSRVLKYEYEIAETKLLNSLALDAIKRLG